MSTANFFRGNVLRPAQSTIFAASVLWRRKTQTMLVDGPNIEMLPDGEHGQRRFKIKVVDTAERRGMVNALIKRRYGWRGYETSHLPTDPSVHKFTLAATEETLTIGSITVNFDGQGKLSADDAFAAEVDELRAEGRKLCEFARLAVDPMVGTKRVLAALFHVAYIVAYRIRGFDTLLIEVNPRHVNYYVRMLGFNVLGTERINRTVNAPSVLLGVEFSYVMQQIGEHGGHPARMATERSLYPAAFSLGEEAAIISRMVAKQQRYDAQKADHEYMCSGPPSDFIPVESIG